MPGSCLVPIFWFQGFEDFKQQTQQALEDIVPEELLKTCSPTMSNAPYKGTSISKNTEGDNIIIMDEGQWNGERIAPQEAVKVSVTDWQEAAETAMQKSVWESIITEHEAVDIYVEGDTLFPTKGTNANCVRGSLFWFGVSAKLTAGSEESLMALREAAGMTPRPPNPQHSTEPHYRFHVSILVLCHKAVLSAIESLRFCKDAWSAKVLMDAYNRVLMHEQGKYEIVVEETSVSHPEDEGEVKFPKLKKKRIRYWGV
jgi:hypothetical protein